MPASYPKPDSQRVTRHKQRFEWTDLDPTVEVEAPDLPDWRKWQADTQTWWAELWQSPQAQMWDATGKTLHTLACLYDDLISGRAEAAKVSSEMRQHEDKHGLNPKAMLQLRWRIAEPDEAAPKRKTGSAKGRRDLKVV